MSSLGVQDMRAILARIAATMTAKKDDLIRLDSTMGDGDLGLTMEKGFLSARDEAAQSAETDLGKLLMKVGMAIARAVPSTMGTLVATGFMSGGKAVSGAAELDLARMADFFDAFVNGMMQRGKSKPGEKTIIDVLYPAAQALKQAASSGASLSEGFAGCRKAAADGLIAARGMVAQHGRLAYYQEKSKGQEDPGAVAGTYIIQGFCDHIASLA